MVKIYMYIGLPHVHLVGLFQGVLPHVHLVGLFQGNLSHVHLVGLSLAYVHLV